MFYTLSCWSRGPSCDGWGPLYDGPQIIKIQTSMNNSTTKLDIKKKISELNLKMNSLILGLLKTRVLGNLTKNGIHNMMDPIHHMLDRVHHMMAFLSIIWWTPFNIWWTGSTIWWIVEYDILIIVYMDIIVIFGFCSSIIISHSSIHIGVSLPETILMTGNAMHEYCKCKNVHEWSYFRRCWAWWFHFNCWRRAK